MARASVEIKPRQTFLGVQGSRLVSSQNNVVAAPFGAPRVVTSQRTVAPFGSPILLETIFFDATLLETHENSVQVTEHPVESGSTIVDHIRVLPFRITIEGVITNADLKGEAPKIEPVEAYGRLLELQQQGQLLTLSTGLRVYRDLVIEGLSIPRDAQTGDALRFNMSLKAVKVVASETRVIEREIKRAPKIKEPEKPKEEVKADAAPVPTIARTIFNWAQ